MNYINIYRRFVITYIKGKLEYNLSLVFELIANTILIGVFFSGFFVIFYNFSEIGSWNQNETLFMMTTSWLSYSFSCFFFWSPMKDMGELVRTGKLDLYLCRPISPMVYLILEQFQYTFLPRLFFAFAFWLYSLRRISVIWTPKDVIYYVISMLSAFVIYSSITVITGSVSFWAIKSEAIVSLLTNNNYGLKNFSDYPITIYGKGTSVLLTFIIPYALTGYYPVAHLLNKPVPFPVAEYISPVSALLIALISSLVWKTGLKRYESAN